jgi:type I restriction enzyme S subunit
MIRAQEIVGGLLKIENAALVNESVFNDFSKNHKSQIGDLVFSRVGAHSGKVSYVATDTPFCLGQNTAFIIPKKVNSKLLYYFMSSHIISEQIERNAIVSSYKTISLKTLRELEINIPESLPEQQAIASILSSLDDKIELNLQMNKTLEEMAMTLYKHWFVDFEFPYSPPLKDKNTTNTSPPSKEEYPQNKNSTNTSPPLKEEYPAGGGGFYVNTIPARTDK